MLMINNTSLLDGGTKATAVFGEAGGLVGAAAEADWVLSDRGGSVADQHLRVLHVDGFFCLEILSDRGIRVNGATQAVGRGESFRVTDGDVLGIGQFEVSAYVTVSLDEDAEQSHGERWAQRFISVGSLVGDAREEEFSGNNLFDSKIMRKDGNIALRERLERAQHVDPVSLLEEQNTGRARTGRDPVAAFDKEWNREGDAMASTLGDYLNIEPEEASHASIPDDLQPSSQYFAPPKARRVDGQSEREQPMSGNAARRDTAQDDMDAYLAMLAASAGNQTTARPSTRDVVIRDRWLGEVETDESQEQLVDHVVLRPLCHALGLPIQSMTVPQADQLARDIGEALKTAITGLMEAHKRELSQRSNLAETHLHAIEDNPLRLDQSVEDVLRDLFLNRSPVHLSASSAIGESLTLLRYHQEASEAASEAALDAVLQALAPLALAKRFLKYKGHAPRSGDLDAWHWTMYQHYYAEMRSSHQGGLSRMFWEVYRQVYDREMRQRSKEI
ncbi:type VI secretion system-associated FHA domain protein TagH [Phyllobacterium leguminum]|nr:type VI secretion system-associated FHA domain protein TagH [Phyllobacterium leguminum]